ncbi:HAD family hydrolase [Arthrobacter sp. zg-Y20]|uniref:HAD family hydrolase n=1 Tax=unclassified Arthrobacter TaxID=235627 RepID=UPI001D155AED|nr:MULTISPECIES: HAD family hydrolase [unclassified Arthrobacter]MCC3276534.1 HAD family hydrolase [Arthrobacter sp. zg-Y20]MDK1316694.1 HAD family hydrolase [Arthrobacter sp. zg.Y20]WIB06883.1 HAD family hydrolase [Arthrobacter sp. zg-Y20]
MRTLFASDLDRTLIYSANALFLDTEDAAAPGLVVSEVYEGKPLSFMTRAAEDLLVAAAEAAVFVPVTTRTVAQYRRIQLPAPSPEYAVTTNGGVILHHGEPDADWQDKVRSLVAGGCAPLAEVSAYLARPEFAAWTLKLRTAEDLFAYAVVDRAALPGQFLLELETWCTERGWTVSLQGRKLYCVPVPVTKQDAVAEVARRTGAERIITAGDSLLDRPMLQAADVAFRPAHGELDDAGYRDRHLQVTAARGVLAGEEILRRVLGLVRG